jgi:hypothetical protein
MDGTEQRSIRRYRLRAVVRPQRGRLQFDGSTFGLPAGSLDQVAIRREARHGRRPTTRKCATDSRCRTRASIRISAVSAPRGGTRSASVAACTARPSIAASRPDKQPDRWTALDVDGHGHHRDGRVCPLEFLEDLTEIHRRVGH